MKYFRNTFLFQTNLSTRRIQRQIEARLASEKAKKDEEERKRQALDKIMEENKRRIQQQQAKLAEERLHQIENERKKREEQEENFRKKLNKKKAEQELVLGLNGKRGKLSFGFVKKKD